MDDLLSILIDAFKREYGEDEKLKTEIIGDKPIKVNYTTGYFE